MNILENHRKQVQSTIAEMQDLIEKLRIMEEAFLKQEEALFVISEFAYDWEYWQDKNGDYQYVSPSCESVTGFTPDDFYQNSNLLQKIIVEKDWQKWLDHSHTMVENGKMAPLEFEICTKHRETKWIHHVCRTVRNSEGKYIGLRGSNRDISDLKALQEKLKHVAGHDHLTGLANRSLFLEHLKQNIKEAQRNSSMFIVSFIDLDGFKEINDQYGHDVGDHVLKRVASDLQQILRKDDIVARFGGDEFVGIFQVSSKDDAATLKKKILKKISNEIVCYLYQITIRFSVGMSVYPTDSRDMDSLLKIADDKMYAMKQKNKANHKEVENNGSDSQL